MENTEHRLERYFNEFRERVLTHPDLFTGKERNFNFKIVDTEIPESDPYRWVIKMGGGYCEVIRGAVVGPTISIEISVDDFFDIVEKRVNPVFLFGKKKIGLDGDLGELLKLGKAF